MDAPMMLHVGFTGTQKGMTSYQEAQLRTEFEEARRIAWHARVGVTLHHGDCIGADLQAHRLAYQMGLAIIIHPPVDVSKRAYSNAGIFNSSGTIELEPEEYLQRNHAIVEATRVLVACPFSKETLRSGTWATVRHARKLKRDTVIIYPDGKITREVHR